MLFRSVLRTFRSRFFQLLGIGLLVLLSSLFYTMVNYSIEGLKEPTERYQTDYVQEDFAIDTLPILFEDEALYAFTECGITEYVDLPTLEQINRPCFLEIMNAREEQLESIYPMDLEMREYKDLADNGYSFRMLRDMEEINLSYIEEGKKPDVGEIALVKIFAEKNDYEIGDTITIVDKDYVVSGFVLFPDYVLPLYGDSFLMMDSGKLTVGLLHNNDFDSLVPNSGSGTAFGGVDVADFKEMKSTVEDADLDYVIQIIKTTSNMRSGSFEYEIKGGQGMAIILGLFIALISIMVIGMVVSRIIQKERNQIGLLKGLGFTNREITMPYVWLMAIISLPLLGLGYYIGYLLAEPTKMLFMEFYLVPDQTISHSWSVILIALVMPFVVIVLLSYTLINMLLRKTPLEMMLPKKQRRGKLVSKIAGYLKRFSVYTRFKFASVFQSFGKFMVFMIGIYFATYMLIFSFMMLGVFDTIMYDYYETVEYESQGYCEYTGCPEGVDGEYIVYMPAAGYEDTVVGLYGIDPDSELHKLYNTKDDEITSKLEEGVIITGHFKLMEGVNKGDTIDLTINNEVHQVKVVEVSNIYTQDLVYFSKANLNEILGVPSDYANSVYSDEILDDDLFMGVSVKEDILAQGRDMQRFMMVSMYAFIAVAVILGFIILYLIMSLTIEDNFYQISLLKVMGFNKKEVNNLVINSYFFIAIVIYITSVPVIYISIKLLELVYARLFNVVMVFKLNPWFILIGLIIVIGMYLVGTIDAKRKINNISLQESLKMYQE